MRPARSSSLAPRDFAQIGAQGFLPPAPPNPTEPDAHSRDAYHPRWPEFWPGLSMVFASVRKAVLPHMALPYLPADPRVLPDEPNQPIDTSSATAFDNTFLLGLRAFAWPESEMAATEAGPYGRAGARGDSGPPQALPSSRPRIPVPWVYENRIVDYPQGTRFYPTYGES